MRLFSLIFLLGILLLQQFPYLPDKKWIILIISIAIFSRVFLSKYRKYVSILIIGALGFAWCLWYAHAQSVWTLPDNLEGKTIVATGHVASIPDTSDHITAFLFSIKTIYFENKMYPAKGLIRLSWRSYKNQKIDGLLKVGDKWQLTVRLKKIHGLMNPGSFDYEAHAFHEGIRAAGYIVNHAENKLLDNNKLYYPLSRAREFLKNKIEKNLPLSNTSPWIIALTLGERHGINQENWEILRNTGTNHLMAIAGLHIGFMSGFTFSFLAWLWRRNIWLSSKIPSQHVGAIAALCMALTYSAMAGFSIPTQRACIMLTVFLIILLLRRKIIAWQAWSIALLTVLFINPLSVLTESFWLSFGAVALIIYGVSARLSPKGIWWKWGRIQWVIAVGLVPFSIWLFQQCSIVSFVANSIAIPWVGFLIVPLCLLGSFILLFSEKIGGIVLTFADQLLGVLWIILTWFSHLPWSSWYQMVPSFWALLIACIGVVILLLPIGFPGRYLGVIGFLPLFCYQVPAPPAGDVWLTLLDVGQGLATVVQTQKHTLVFDTGAKLGKSYDMGESVVIPFLRSIGAKQIDMLVISHGDNDHIGGSGALLKRLPVRAIKSSVPKKLPVFSSYCLRGEAWTWDQVHFKFLYPSPDTLNLNNDSSCVLRITAGNKHILLTGDIEKFSEKYLVKFEEENLKANILVAPHHGSKTSGVDAFLQAVNPQHVLFPFGYRNRYHFPHKSIIEKYDLLQSKKWDTAHAGAIMFFISANNAISDPVVYRDSHKRYWNHVMN